MTLHEHEFDKKHSSGEIFSQTMSYEEMLHTEQVLIQAMQNPTIPNIVRDIYVNALIQLHIQMEIREA